MGINYYEFGSCLSAKWGREENSIFSFGFSFLNSGVSRCRIVSFMHRICRKQPPPDVLTELRQQMG